MIPMLAIIPLLAVPGISPSGSEGGHSSLSLVEHLPGWAHGLVLGLFFITVGAGINFGVLAESWDIVLLLALAVIIGNALILVGLALAFGIRSSDGWLFTLGLAQAGEFGFVLLTYST